MKSLPHYTLLCMNYTPAANHQQVIYIKQLQLSTKINFNFHHILSDTFTPVFIF